MPPENANNGQIPAKSGKSAAGRLIVALVLLVVILVLGRLAYMRYAEPDEAADFLQEERAIAVETAPVAARTLQDSVSGVGSLQPLQTVAIKPEVHGKLAKINFREGGVIEKGQVLFEIEDEKLRRGYEARKAALASTRTRLENLRRNYERISTLRERELVSQDQYDNVKTELEAVSSDVNRLKAELELAKRELEDTVIRSPFDGYISEQLVDSGTFVSAGEPLAVIYQIDPLRISFFIGEKYAGRVAYEQDVFVSVAAYPDRQFRGKVNFISPVIKEQTRKFQVRADIDNPEKTLTPGSFASVRLVLERRKNRPVIPEQALVPTRTGYIVYVVDNGNYTAKRREVETGLRKPGIVEIVKGLSQGETVVVYGHMRLEDGSRVDVLDAWDKNWPGENDQAASSDPAPVLTNTATALGG